MIWSATSRTPDPGSVLDVQRGIAGLVISELTKRNIVASKRTEAPPVKNLMNRRLAYRLDDR